MSVFDYNRPWKAGLAHQLKAGDYVRGVGLVRKVTQVAMDDHVEVRLVIYNRTTVKVLKHSELVFALKGGAS